jgi:hypothetical protein
VSSHGQEGTHGRRLSAVRNFLMRFEEKELSLAREWFMKKKKYVKNIYRSLRVGFLVQLREG